jgi:hypothetical protein
MVMFKTIAVTISAAAFVTLCIALGPNVPDALATARAMIVTKDDVKLAEPTAEPSCSVFEVWFLDPTCSQTQHAKKAARIKRRLAQRS